MYNFEPQLKFPLVFVDFQDDFVHDLGLNKDLAVNKYDNDLL